LSPATLPQNESGGGGRVADLFVFAGEASGDLHGSGLLKSLNALQPNLDILGVGGPKMRQEKFTCTLPMEKFQVMGFVDVALALPKLIRQFYRVRQMILQANPKVVVLIDYPGFNLRLARSLRKKGFRGKICHYICPSVWAWGKSRIGLLAKHYDLLLSILPFEKQCFERTSLRVEYVGNPLIATIPAFTKAEFPERWIGLFPGSRRKEIERNFPLQLRVAKRVLQDHPAINFAVSVSHPRFQRYLEELARGFPGLTFIPADETRRFMQKIDLAIAKSGTVTLELALHAVPTVVTYGISTFDAFLAKHIFRINLPHYCLVNILAGKTVFPELIGPALTEEALYTQTQKFLTHPTAYTECQKACLEVRALLGTQNASQTAASLILSLMER
jgi:lipid-A-disaccharide synthase